MTPSRLKCVPTDVLVALTITFCPGDVTFLPRVTTYFPGVLHITDGRGNRNYITKMEQARNSLYPDSDDDDDEDEDRFFKDTDTFRVSYVRNCWN